MWDVALGLLCGCLTNSTFDLSRREISGMCGCDLFGVIFMACAGYTFCLLCVYSAIVDGQQTPLVKCSGEVCQIHPAMARSSIRSWNELCRLAGYAEADDPESARAAIVTNFVSSHQNPII